MSEGVLRLCSAAGAIHVASPLWAAQMSKAILRGACTCLSVLADCLPELVRTMCRQEGTIFVFLAYVEHWTDYGDGLRTQ
jgi:hypothetical protein